jgi:hypothetical protein
MAAKRSLAARCKRLGKVLTWPRLALVAMAAIVAIAARPHHEAIESLAGQVAGWRPSRFEAPPAPPPSLPLPHASSVPGVAAEILAAARSAGLIRIQVTTGKVIPSRSDPDRRDLGPGPGFARVVITLSVEGSYARIYALARTMEARPDSVLVSAAVKRDPPGVKAQLAFEIVLRQPAPETGSPARSPASEEARS